MNKKKKNDLQLATNLQDTLDDFIENGLSA